MDQYVNDRPYAASSFLSVALNKAFRTAMTGVSRERAELALMPILLDIVVAPLPVQNDDLLERLFAPLGWRVEARRIGGADGPSRYVELRLSGTLRLADALSHLYVLIPALDADKHYWVGEDEVEKLVAKAGPWLASHPDRETIARRYLKNRRSLARAALARLDAEAETEVTASALRREEALEAPLRLHDRRLDAVAALLKESGARRVADLGCGEGRLLQRLVKERTLETLIGVDASSRDLERARERLKLDLAGGPSRRRIRLLHGALTYRDARWADVDAAALVEVIEHLDAARLPALADAVFGAARPKTVIVTTPNNEYNALFADLPAGQFRHPDHRFEFTREQFADWAQSVAERYGYRVALSGLGDDHPEHGPVCEMGVFSR